MITHACDVTDCDRLKMNHVLLRVEMMYVDVPGCCRACIENNKTKRRKRSSTRPRLGREV